MTGQVITWDVFLVRKIRIVAARLKQAMENVEPYKNDNRLAKALHTNPSRVASWRDGEHLPSTEHLFGACELLGVSPQYLFGENEEEARGRVARELQVYGLGAESDLLLALGRLGPAERRRLIDRALGWIEASTTDDAPEAESALPRMPHDEMETPISEERPARRRKPGAPSDQDAPSSLRKR